MISTNNWWTILLYIDVFYKAKGAHHDNDDEIIVMEDNDIKVEDDNDDVALVASAECKPLKLVTRLYF